MRTLVAAGLILAAGLGVFTWASDGWRAVTAEGARRLAVAAHPVTIPGVTMEDMDGHVLHLSQFKGRVVLVEFIYTTCPTVCQDLGAGFAEILERVRRLEPPRPREVDPSMHPGLEECILRAMAKEPADRYPDAQAFSDDLEDWIRSTPDWFSIIPQT